MRIIKAFSKFKDLHRKNSHKNRKWITEGHKVYPNKTKTYGPSTSNFVKGKRFESISKEG